ncbi:MAG TPA: 2-oxo acid dehydrogenase subunit E2 [Gemmataceae bacterium]|nr:2-oxo acid dehydrogenase subunit E2 [Gemmataceae bacterium]
MAVLVDILVPDAQEQSSEAIVERWLCQPGDRVRLHEPLLEINTDKAVIEVPAPASGVLREILRPARATVGPNDVLGRIEVGEEDETPQRASSPDLGKTTAAPDSGGHKLSPAVRALVKKHNVDPSLIRGSGRDGRITYEDVQNYLKRPDSSTGIALPTGTLIPHSPLRLRIAQHMVESMLETAPHVTAVFDMDLSAVVAHRQEHLEPYGRKGIRLTYTAYFVAAAAKALQSVPEVNSRWREDALEVFHDCNIGIATAVKGGLLVPVLHHAQTFDLFRIASRLQELTDKARTGKLEPDELRHGTFTITNHGTGGSLIATPIIHQPQSAILGVGKIEKRLVVVEEHGKDTLQIQPRAYVTLTIDHRALDGFQANLFLSRFAEVLADFRG